MLAVALSAWWPLDPYWQSDDFIALHWASDLGRALHDFAGNQYGLQGLVWFYRPLITLSFWVDQQLGFVQPFVSHLSNVVAHGASAVLLALVAARFVGGARAVGAALVWAVHPAHAGAVLWAVGRVDSHTTVWILLSLWLSLRAVEGRRGARWASLTALALALCSKELALVVPPLVTVLAAGAAEPGRRWRTAVSSSWPHFALLVPYFGLRWFLFGRLLGGYEGGALQPLAAMQGLFSFTLQLLNPLHGHGALLEAQGLPAAVAWAGFLPAAVGVAALCVRRRWQLLAGICCCYAIAVAPTFQFWADTTNPLNLRYFYLPTACLAVLVAGAGIGNALLALAVAALPLLDVRAQWREWQVDLRTMHQTLLREANELEAGPMFQAGLPRASPAGVLGFHLGVDRLLAPPFSTAGQRLYALRPLDQRPDAQALPYGDEHGLPGGRTFAFEGPRIWHAVAPTELPPLQARIEGPSHLSGDVLWRLYRDGAASRFVLGEAAPTYRITLFTAGGYVTALLPNENATGSGGGTVSLGAWLQARHAGGAHTFVLEALKVPAVLDLQPTFPVMIEAGELTEAPGGTRVFRARAATRQWLTITLDRDYAEFLAGR